MKIIDPHLHLFNIEQGEYHWLKPENPPLWPDKKLINQSFSEDDLQLNNELTLAGFVHIEAGFDNKQPWREIAWLEENCQLPFKSIAGIDLSLNTSEFIKSIQHIKNFSSVVGVRDILDEKSVDYLSNQQVVNNLRQLSDHQLIFELQMPLDNLHAVELLSTVLSVTQQLKVVINHAGWPPYQNDKTVSKDHNNWLKGLEILGRHPKCSIKCSGFELTNRSYSKQWQMNVITTCLEYFGTKRVMLASNFPLCLLAKSYQNYWQQYQQNVLFSESTLNNLFFINTKRIYQF